jgi:hypothetical protein
LSVKLARAGSADFLTKEFLTKGEVGLISEISQQMFESDLLSIRLNEEKNSHKFDYLRVRGVDPAKALLPVLPSRLIDFKPL